MVLHTSVINRFMIVAFSALLVLLLCSCSSYISSKDRSSKIVGNVYQVQVASKLVRPSNCAGWSAKLMIMPIDYLDTCQGDTLEEFPEKSISIKIANAFIMKGVSDSCIRIQAHLLGRESLGLIEVPSCGPWHPPFWIKNHSPWEDTIIEVFEEYLKQQPFTKTNSFN